MLKMGVNKLFNVLQQLHSPGQFRAVQFGSCNGNEALVVTLHNGDGASQSHSTYSNDTRYVETYLVSVIFTIN